eukprot:TRINITY_DN27745_c0_g1_i1.p2 TRINITY_DN27745_c0_g1~~TRINITY_DN27745_c0_g1_i1.p2  ORF type:complete len:314 (+),score=56.24 TRINITY_DN27745_c0_g1_i1:80-1021(+)
MAGAQPCLQGEDSEEDVPLLPTELLVPARLAAFYTANEVFSYDPDRFGLAVAVRALLDVSDGVPLHGLHTPGAVPDLPKSPALLRALVASTAAEPSEVEALRCRQWGDRQWKRAMQKAFQASHEYAAFLDEYRRFVHEVIRPRLGEARVVYQSEPALRVAVPSTRAGIGLHRDLDYGHPPTEVNFWVPLTNVSGANTLHLETAAGRGDYAPVDAAPGDVLQFWGNQRFHHTVPNTSAATRVSFDFRVIPGVLYARYPPIGMEKGTHKQFRVGGFYSVACPARPRCGEYHGGGAPGRRCECGLGRSLVDRAKGR